MPIRVKTPSGVVEFPDGTPEAEMMAALSSLPDPVTSHEPEPAKAQHPHARVGQWVKDNAPMVGGGLAAFASGGASLPLQAIAAAGGGFLGSRLRGDSREDAATEGAIEGGLQGGMGLAMKGAKAVAHGLMRGTVPKNISTNFDDVDIAGAALKAGAVPGSARSARRIEGLSRIANDRVQQSASQVPPVTRGDAFRGLRPLYQEAKAAGMPDRAGMVFDRAKDIIGEIPARGLSGSGALARKGILQQEGKAALNAPNPKAAALGPQLADAERSGIVQSLRRSPAMGDALDNSQRMMALDRVMKDAAHSNPVTRARVGGLPAAALSPMGMSLTAHGLNQGSKALDPQLVRALMALLGERSGQE